MRNDVLYFVQLNPKLNDGGLSRNLAFHDYYVNKGATTLNVYRNNKISRIIVSLSLIRVLLFLRHRTIFIHQGTIIYLFPMSILKYKILFNLIFKAFQCAANHNRLIVEVNDLPYEQAIDLELEIDVNYEKFEQKLYSLKKCHFIFASQQMNDYIKKKFRIVDGNSEVIINGATRLMPNELLPTSINDLMNKSGLKCVYAGTLNKGRQIESLIEIFKGLPNMNLILLGDWGEWLVTYGLPSNVIYLGNKENNLAQQIVSKCDLGLIQYSSDRFYYNLCFPTKISFYLTAGVPVLSTPLTELKFHFENSKSVFFVEFNNWHDFLLSLNENLLQDSKRIALQESLNYEWSKVLSSSKFLNS